MENEGVLRKSYFDFSKRSEIVQTIIIALIAFLIPTFLGIAITTIFGESSAIASNSQIIIGSIVNTMLIVAALNLKGWQKIILIVTMPSISAIFSGVVLKTSAVFAMYMIPGIWIGNFALICVYKYLHAIKRLNYFITAMIAILSKVAIIFGFFSILNIFNMFPEKVVTVMQQSMGVIQLVTATIGAFIAFGIYKLQRNHKKS